LAAVYIRVGGRLTQRVSIAPTWTKDRTRSTPKVDHRQG
jgi:hypothetical protein